jgi:hypothetical protein
MFLDPNLRLWYTTSCSEKESGIFRTDQRKAQNLRKRAKSELYLQLEKALRAKSLSFLSPTHYFRSRRHLSTMPETTPRNDKGES